MDLLESKQKEIDIKLSDPVLFKELNTQPNFFNNYELVKNNIKSKESEWEALVSELSNFKKTND